MAKIKAYDFNREENTLTVKYESGVVRKYSADRLPKSVYVFICEDVVSGTISSLIEEYKAEHKSLIPVYRCEKINSDTHREIGEKLHVLSSKFKVLEDEFLHCPVSQLCDRIHYWYSVFSNAVSSDNEFYIKDRRRTVPALEAIKELSKRLCFSPDDDSFELTFSHILSIRFPESSDDVFETEETTSELPEQSEDESETEETAPDIPDTPEPSNFYDPPKFPLPFKEPEIKPKQLYYFTDEYGIKLFESFETPDDACHTAEKLANEYDMDIYVNTVYDGIIFAVSPDVLPF